MAQFEIEGSVLKKCKPDRDRGSGILELFFT